MNKDELKTEIDRENFHRAALLAASLEFEGDIKDLQRKALWQMAAENRNANGTKKICQEYGFTKDALREFLRTRAQEITSKEDDKALKARYDYSAGKHLGFEAWLDDFFKNWKRMAS